MTVAIRGYDSVDSDGDKEMCLALQRWIDHMAGYADRVFGSIGIEENA